MIKIAIISPYERFAKHARNIGDELTGVQVDTFLGYFEEGFKLAKEAEAKGYDAIIARGITYENAKKHVAIPVVNAQESLHDLIRALYQVKGSKQKINLFIYENNAILHDLKFYELLKNLFDIDLTLTKYNSSESYELLFRKMIRDYDVFIGGAFVVQLCEAYGKQAVLWETGYDTLYMKIKESINLAKARKSALIQANQLKTVLDNAYEGIIYIDKELKVKMINPMAKRVLKLYSNNEIIGRSIKDILKDDQLPLIMSDRISIYNEYHKLENNVDIMVNKVPVIINNNVEGIVVNFKEVEQVLQMEKEIRAKLSQKGSVAKYDVDDIVGVSNKITAIKSLVERFGKYDSNVLIYGETGTGKELFAQSIHNASKRITEPFYAINCATLPENLLESELFGYSDGAFTGAKKGGKPGLFELAHNGTLFLDEIGEMPLTFQSKLLRALQEKEIRRLGDDKMISINVRIIAASHKNLYDEMLKGNFREDLFYRLSVMNIGIPPLRERHKDIPFLINYFMDVYKEKLNIEAYYKFDKGSMEYLTNYIWRGNVRELQNFVERVYIYNTGNEVITVEKVKELLHGCNSQSNQSDELLAYGTLNNITEIAIQEALERSDGNKTQAAKYLGVSRSFLWRRLKNKESL